MCILTIFTTFLLHLPNKITTDNSPVIKSDTPVAEKDWGREGSTTALNSEVHSGYHLEIDQGGLEITMLHMEPDVIDYVHRVGTEVIPVCPTVSLLPSWK